jgi:uncharacterized protein YbjT (DUF2867 family)
VRTRDPPRESAWREVSLAVRRSAAPATRPQRHPIDVRILVLGASGGCGNHVVDELIARGAAVTAIVRPRSTWSAPPGVAVVRDEILRPGAIASAMPGHDAVVSCVGIRRRWPRNPWSALRSPADLTATTARLAIDGMARAGVTRIAAISAAGVGTGAPMLNWMMRWLVRHSNVGHAYRDLAAMEDVLAASGMDWLAVRPVTLTSGRAKPVHVVDRFGLTATISRRSVARWLVDRVLDGGARCDHTPTIAS